MSLNRRENTEAGTVGVIVAGGLSRRMGGDKGLKLLAGRPLIAHVEAAVRPQVAALALNVNGDAAAYVGMMRETLPVLADTVEGFAGPLAGVLAGMSWAARSRWLVSVPGDTPFLPADLVQRLTAAAESEGADVACASSRGRLHPVAALWRPALASDLAAYLASGERKVEVFLRRYRVATVDFPAEPLDPFFNVNTAADLEEAEQGVREREERDRHLRVRILIGEATTLGPGKAALLDGIGRRGSISGAARELGMSYRRAWLLVDAMNRDFRADLVTTAVGGAGGGGACVTPLGAEVLCRYRDMERRAADSIRPQLSAFAELLRT